MSKIGSLGKKIIFRVSDEKVLTFQNLKHTVSGRWVKHAPIFGKPACEFQGSDLEGATITIQLDALLGVKPRRILDNLEYAANNGEKLPFIVGGKKVIPGNVVITQVSESYDTVMRNGKLFLASVDVTLMQYE